MPANNVVFTFRWRFVVHGCIDGYSRKIIYLRCANNNRSDTLLALFMNGIRENGLPMRVRGDRGGKNVLVARFMLEHPLRDGKAGFIAGRSVHNQRIERLWQDVFQQCIVLYYHLFYYMESIGLLNVDNECHLYCLHYVYLSRINCSLTKFANAWNHHLLSSEGNLTPVQLWTAGLMRNGSYHLEVVKRIKFYHLYDIYNNYWLGWRFLCN